MWIWSFFFWIQVQDKRCLVFLITCQLVFVYSSFCWPLFDFAVLTVTSSSVWTMCLIIQAAEKTDKIFRSGAVHSHNMRQRKHGRLCCHMQGIWSLSSLLLPRDLHDPGQLSWPPLLSALPVRWPVVPQLHEHRARGRPPLVCHHLRLRQGWALGLLSRQEWVMALLIPAPHSGDRNSASLTTVSSHPTVHCIVVSSFLLPWSNGLHISFPHCQAAAVRHSGIPTRWQTAATSLTSRRRCRGARLGSVASSRGQTC